MKVAVFFYFFAHFDCKAAGSFVFSKPDIQWIENIQTLFNTQFHTYVLSYSVPAACIL